MLWVIGAEGGLGDHLLRAAFGAGFLVTRSIAAVLALVGLPELSR
jgi:hypothetical protein